MRDCFWNLRCRLWRKQEPYCFRNVPPAESKSCSLPWSNSGAGAQPDANANTSTNTESLSIAHAQSVSIAHTQSVSIALTLTLTFAQPIARARNTAGVCGIGGGGEPWLRECDRQFIHAVP
ncbi:MAG TPA: hypothetical protein VI488_07250 [Candidatus Angelobacter sp.]